MNDSVPGSYPTSEVFTIKNASSPISSVPLASSTLLQSHPLHGGGRWIFYWPLDLRPTLLWNGSSEVTDLLICYRTRHPHSSPRCRVTTLSPRREVAHSQSLHDDNDGVFGFNEFYNYCAGHMRPDRQQFPLSPVASAPPLSPMPGEEEDLVFYLRWMLVYVFGLGLHPGDLVLGTKHFGVANTLITVCSAISRT